MAIEPRLATRPGAGFLPSARPIATVPVLGILTVALQGGNAGWLWTRDLVAEAIAEFVPGSVPLIDGHNATGRAAPIVGSIDSLAPSVEGLRFAGAVTAATAERIRHVGADVSPELRSLSSLPTRRAFEIEFPSTPPPGLLVAVAILSRPARAARLGSCLWLTKETTPMDDDPQHSTQIASDPSLATADRAELVELIVTLRQRVDALSEELELYRGEYQVQRAAEADELSRTGAPALLSRPATE